MKKKCLCFLLCLMFAIGNVAYAENFMVSTDLNETLNNSTLIPLRYAAENSGYVVEWNDIDRSITMVKDDNVIKIKINDENVALNGEIVNLKYTPVLIGDKTYLPIEFYNSIFTDKYIVQNENGDYNFLDKNEISSDNMYNIVSEISQIPRGISDETHDKAMQYVIDKFEEYGYTVEKQEFDYENQKWGESEKQIVKATNLIAVKKADTNPNGDILILGAHYDGEDEMPAANDNGSGLSVLLELARVLKYLPSDTEIRFVAFDVEEKGLIGSKHYVRNLTDSDKVIGMINFDMLAGAKAEKVEITTYDGNNNYLIDVLKNNLNFTDVSSKAKSFGLSDYASFSSKVIPAIDFSHNVIDGEYHSENDIVQNMSKDMLYYAADAGYSLSTTIMSNITPSFIEVSRPKENYEIIELPVNKNIPVMGNIEYIEKELEATLTQIVSDDDDAKYKINAKLFGIETPFEVVYRGTYGSGTFIQNPTIDLMKTTYTFEEIKSILDEKIGEPKLLVENETTISYRYDNIYGYSIILFYDRTPNNNLFEIQFHSYTDDEKEAYMIQNGELVRMTNPELATDYEVKKNGDKILVTNGESSSVPDENLEISDKAKKCWDKIKPMLSKFEIEDLKYLVLESDGLNIRNSINITDIAVEYEVVLSPEDKEIEIPEEYQKLPKNVQSLIKHVISIGVDGETRKMSDTLKGTRIIIDYNDILDERGNAYANEDFVRQMSIAKGLSLARAGNLNGNYKYPENGSPFEKNTYFMAKGELLYAFAEKFYQEIFGVENWFEVDIFEKYPNSFMCANAASDIYSDIAYSFAEFICEEKPVGNSVKEQKIRFFYDYPDCVAYRERIDQ